MAQTKHIGQNALVGVQLYKEGTSPLLTWCQGFARNQILLEIYCLVDLLVTI